MIAPVKIKEIVKKRQEVPFYNEIDLLTIDNDRVIGVSGKITSGFRLLPVNIEMKTQDGKKSFFTALGDVLNNAREGAEYSVVVRKRDVSFELSREYLKEIKRNDILSGQIAKMKAESVQKTGASSYEIYLFVGSADWESNGLTSFFIRPSKKYWRRITHEHYKKRVRDLEGIEDHVLQGLEASGVRPKRMSHKELLRYMYLHLNPGRMESAGIEPWMLETADDSERTLRSKLILDAPRIGYDHFYLDEYYHQNINLYYPPREVGVNNIEGLLRSADFEFDLMLTFRPLPRGEEERRLQFKANMAKSVSFLSVSKNYDSIEKCRQIDELLTNLKRSGQKLFECTFQMLVKARDKEDVKSMSAKLLRNLGGFGGAHAILDNLNHDRLFLSYLPGSADYNERKFTLQTKPLSYLLPVRSAWKGCKKSKILLKNSFNEPVKLDLFDENLPAKHAIMLGTTGSGKSFTANYLLTNFITENDKNHVVIVDIGGSYRKLAEIFGGSYMEIEFSDKYAMNPLPPKKDMMDGASFTREYMNYLVLLIQKMIFDAEMPDVNSEDVRLIEIVLRKVYSSLEGSEEPLISDIRDKLGGYSAGSAKERKRAYEFARKLEIWTEGMYGDFLNRKGRYCVDNRLMVFDLRKLENYPRLQSVVFFVLRTVLERKLEDIHLNKLVVIDEGWKFFDDEIGSKLVEDLYRTARKFNCGILSISQSPHEFLSSKASSAILTNSYVRYVLKLNKGLEEISKMGINETERKHIGGLSVVPGKYSDLFVKFRDESAVVRIKPTPLEYWISTTNPQDTAVEARLKKECPGLSGLSLLSELARKYPHGAMSVE